MSNGEQIDPTARSDRSGRAESRSERPVRVAVTVGDANGIGPEVALRAVARPDVRRQIEPLLVGPPELWEREADRLDVPESERCWSVRDPGRAGASGEEDRMGAAGGGEVSESDVAWHGYGRIRAEAGRAAMRAVELAVELCRREEVEAMTTAPISKEAVVAAGWRIPGHTEFIADRVGAERHAMMMTADELRVVVLTTHVPIAEVADRIDRDLVREKLTVLAESLRRDFGREESAIAVLGLNPHAGDGGVIGREEEEVIRPALASWTGPGVGVEGPFAADAFFGGRTYERFDAVLACYHDQGLVPFKMLSRRRGVNVTIGLPIVRTSPDHGTAFDIAGTGRADPSSMARALLTAARIARRRARNGSTFHG